MTNFTTILHFYWLCGIHWPKQHTYESILVWKHCGTKNTQHIYKFIQMCRDKNFSHFCQIIFSIHLELPNLFINTYIPGPHVHFSIHIPRWRINTLEYHRFVIVDSVDKRFKLNKRSLDITNSGNQRHEGYDFPCFNLPTWTPCTMHTMRRSSKRHLSSFYVQPSTLSTYHGLKSTNNTPQYFYSLTQSTRF